MPKSIGPTNKQFLYNLGLRLYSEVQFHYDAMSDASKFCALDLCEYVTGAKWSYSQASLSAGLIAVSYLTKLKSQCSYAGYDEKTLRFLASSAVPDL